MISPELDVSIEVDIQENVLLCSTTKSDELHPNFEDHRRRPHTKHPLLTKLLETENDDMKHSDYTAHLLIQRQTREYAFAVEDVLRVLKRSTECINKCEAVWWGDNNKVCGTSAYNARGLGQNLSPEISQIGKGILVISEAVRRLHEHDALTFWASQQRVLVLKQLVSFARDAMKLYRKLGRIKSSLEDRVRNVRRAAIMCECEITGNLVPSEIYYQWVKEDSVIYKDNCWDNANASLQKLSKVKEKIRAIRNTAKNLVSCFQTNNDDADSTSPSDSSNTVVSQSTANISVPVQVYQMNKHLQILHNSDPSHAEDSICELSLKSTSSTPCTTPHSVNGNDAPIPATTLEDVWVPKPSQKYMKAIASNVTPPKKLNTFDYSYDRCESRVQELCKKSELESIAESEGNFQNDATSLTSNCNTIEDLLNTTTNSTILSTKASDILRPGTSLSTGTAQKFLNDSMEQQISSIINAKNAMSNAVARITYSVREMERDWVSPRLQNLFERSSIARRT